MSGAGVPMGSTLGAKPNLKVLREPVMDSPGIKQIERKSPTAEPVVRKRLAPARQELPDYRPESKKRGLLLAVTVAATGAVGAALYFSGLLKALFGG